MTILEILIGSGIILWSIDKIIYQYNKYKTYKYYYTAFIENLLQIEIELNNAIISIDEYLIAISNGKNINCYQLDNYNTFEIYILSYIKMSKIFKNRQDFVDILFWVKNFYSIRKDILDVITVLNNNNNNSTSPLIGNLILYKQRLNALYSVMNERKVFTNTIKINILYTIFKSEIE